MGTGTDDFELVEIELVEETPTTAPRAVKPPPFHPDQVLRKLDRRRDSLLDWRWELHEHGRSIAIAAGVVALVAGATIATARLRARARRRPAARLARTYLSGVLKRLIARPEQVAPARPHVGQKVLAAALTGLISAGVRMLVLRVEHRRWPEGA